MSFGGHVSTMINRLKENRSLLNRKSIKDKRRDAFENHYQTRKTSKQTHHKKANPEVLQRIRKALRKNKSNHQKKLWLIISTMIIPILF